MTFCVMLTSLAFTMLSTSAVKEYDSTPLNTSPLFDGLGVSNDPFLIKTTSDLQTLRKNTQLYHAHFALANDLTFSREDFINQTTGWEPIGTINEPFSGSLNGNSHMIKGLFSNNPKLNHIGLFGYLTGEVMNLKLETVTITGSENVGSVAGKQSGIIKNVAVTGDVSGNRNAGAITGINTGIIENSKFEGIVKGNITTGGLIGQNLGTLKNSTTAGSVSGDSEAGGLTARNTGNISNSIANSEVSASIHVGGLVGKNKGNIQDSSATGSVIGSIFVGGLAGGNHGEISHSVATGNTYGLNGLEHFIITCSYSDSICEIGSRTGVTEGNDYIGGIAGYNNKLIHNSSATGNVTGDSQIGGLVGFNLANISHSQAHGTVTGNSSVGGLIGENNGTVTNSVSSGNVSGNSFVNNLIGLNYGTIANSKSNGTANTIIGITSTTSNTNLQLTTSILLGCMVLLIKIRPKKGLKK